MKYFFSRDFLAILFKLLAAFTFTLIFGGNSHSWNLFRTGFFIKLYQQYHVVPVSTGYQPRDWGLGWLVHDDRLVHESMNCLVYAPPPHHHHISITMQQPMHGPACSSSQTPIPWLVTCRHRDYMILLLSHTKFANFQVNLFISYSLQLCFWSSQWQVG